MSTWHWDRLRYTAAILGNEPTIARADVLLARLDLRERRDAPVRRALDAAKRLRLLEG